MRIRKNAKISPLIFNSSSGSTETLVCKLNQSPWDIITFPPSTDLSNLPYQVEVHVSFAGNGSLPESTGPVESVASMENHKENNNNNNQNDVKIKRGFCEKKKKKKKKKEEVERETPVGFNNGGERERGEVEVDDVVLCSKTDGKGWQCGKEVKKGHKMCDHHLEQLQNRQNYAVLTGKRSNESMVTPKRRPRVKKPSAAVNPHDFYYYSGFGPLWGKKRGPGQAQVEKGTTATAPSTTTMTTSTSNGGNVGDTSSGAISGQVEESKRVDLATTRMTPSSSESADERKEIAYIEIEDDEDEDEEDNAGNNIGKKRKRKPIKARSLKSLM